MKHSVSFPLKYSGSVGFRNLVVREYGKLELKQVFEVMQEGTKDLNERLVSILNKLGFDGLVKKSVLSFPRKRESRYFKMLWTPAAFAGVTDL
jgi:hypothetical protein